MTRLRRMTRPPRDQRRRGSRPLSVCSARSLVGNGRRLWPFARWRRAPRRRPPHPRQARLADDRSRRRRLPTGASLSGVRHALRLAALLDVYRPHRVVANRRRRRPRPVAAALAESPDQTVVVVAHWTVVSLYLARHAGQDALTTWRRLPPLHAVLDRQGGTLEALVTDLPDEPVWSLIDQPAPGASSRACRAATSRRTTGATSVPSNSIERMTWAWGSVPSPIWNSARWCPKSSNARPASPRPASGLRRTATHAARASPRTGRATWAASRARGRCGYHGRVRREGDVGGLLRGRGEERVTGDRQRHVRGVVAGLAQRLAVPVRERHEPFGNTSDDGERHR